MVGLYGMFELPALAIINRVANAGLAPVIVTAIVAADTSTVRTLVAGRGRPVVAQLPLARVQMVPSASTRIVRARVLLIGRDVLSLTWILAPRRGTTEVDLAAQFESRGLAVRLALLLGGRRWLARRLDAMLRQVATRVLRTAEGFDDTTSSAPGVPRAPAV